MPRQTLKNPERGDARTRLLEAARDVIRRKATPPQPLMTSAAKQK
nr:hypothetical protein [Sneathiella glossodoripedis]